MPALYASFVGRKRTVDLAQPLWRQGSKVEGLSRPSSALRDTGSAVRCTSFILGGKAGQLAKRLEGFTDKIYQEAERVANLRDLANHHLDAFFDVDLGRQTDGEATNGRIDRAREKLSEAALQLADIEEQLLKAADEACESNSWLAGI